MRGDVGHGGSEPGFAGPGAGFFLVSPWSRVWLTAGRKNHFWSRPGWRLARPLGRVLASPGRRPGLLIFCLAGAWLLPGFFLAFFAGAWPRPRSAPWLKPGWSLAGAWLEPG